MSDPDDRPFLFGSRSRPREISSCQNRASCPWTFNLSWISFVMRNEEKVSVGRNSKEVRRPDVVRPNAHDPPGHRGLSHRDRSRVFSGRSHHCSVPYISVLTRFKSPDISSPFDDGVARDSARTAAHQVYRLAGIGREPVAGDGVVLRVGAVDRCG